MSDIVVLSWAFTGNPDQWKYLRESAARHRVPLTVSGAGIAWPDSGIFDYILAGIRERSEKYLVLTDAYDVIVSRWDADEVISMIDAEPSGVIHSCECECWPPGEWCPRAYPEPHGVWFAVNGGQWCGTKDALIADIEANLKYPTTSGGANQERYHKMIADGYPTGRDTECRIFQSMSGRSSSLVERRNGRAYNTITGTFPQLLHFNGRTPGIESWSG